MLQESKPEGLSLHGSGDNIFAEIVKNIFLKDTILVRLGSRGEEKCPPVFALAKGKGGKEILRYYL
ncbi:MAG: hypothetical protein DYG83_03845 [Candidatus Brocadia sp. AMX2]|nr:MAG: hypothetical protein EDM70_00460 [Candidatus Brocadia sp. AMX2]MBC6931203.1 hypothetical protein [Candidatus Brocadia sp.]MBL1168626.1 hypothetical protein [Candidatus Brocadia sp. AMX1]MCE7865955.1 hypothetical protein [Candidatus Brocadia sp. AMX2]MCQ3916315.1 hypothetical protein [Candidatus Brocadia sp.]